MKTVAAALLLLAALSPAGAQAPSPAGARCTAIHFARGASSAQVSGVVGSDEPFPCYTLATGNGQTASLKFTRTNGNMAFSIDDLADDRDAFEFKTAAKTYRFTVFQTLRAPPGPYTLMVSVR